VNCLKLTSTIFSVLFLILVSSLTFAETPKFKNMRYEENWSSYDKNSEHAMFSPIKRANLSQNGKVWASFGGQIRNRHEFWDGFGFGASASDDDDFNLTRIRLHGDLHLGPNARIFMEGIAALATERELAGGRRTGDNDSGDFMNAFIELQTDSAPNKGHKIRFGRQEISYGKQRIISAANWSNTRRNFDGIKGIFNFANWRLDAFWARPVTKIKYDINKSNDDQEFYGVYASGNPTYIPGNIEAYILGLDRSSRTFNGTSGQEERYTIGTRLWGPISGTAAFYEFEGAYQFGDHGTADIDAFMLTGELGIKPAGWPAGLKVWLAADYATGDDGAGDGDSETFDPLFPTGHGHLGYADQLGRFNIIDFRPGLTFKSFADTSVKVDFHNFWRADTDDALYNTGGGVIIAAAASSDSYVGSEIDITLKKKFTPNWDALLIYSHFFTGDTIEDGIASEEDIDAVYVQLQFTF
jgi:hypothetical protein